MIQVSYSHIEGCQTDGPTDRQSENERKILTLPLVAYNSELKLKSKQPAIACELHLHYVYFLGRE